VLTSRLERKLNMKKVITLLLMAAMVGLPLDMAFGRGGGDRAGGGGRARVSDRGDRGGSRDRARQAERDKAEDKDSGREVDRR
jgi:hypothetical protein